MKKMLFFCSLIIILAGFSTAQKSPPSNGIAGKWLFVLSSEKDLGKIPDNQVPDLKFEDSSRHVSGSSGCNKIAGSYTISGDQLVFGPMISTFRACPDMEVEQYITHFLVTVGTFKIDENKLYLYDKDDKGNYVMYRKFDQGLQN